MLSHNNNNNNIVSHSKTIFVYTPNTIPATYYVNKDWFNIILSELFLRITWYFCCCSFETRIHCKQTDWATLGWNDLQIVSGDKCNQNFSKFILQLRESLGNKFYQKIDTAGNRIRSHKISLLFKYLEMKILLFYVYFFNYWTLFLLWYSRSFVWNLKAQIYDSYVLDEFITFVCKSSDS